jgi:hypothetical protein
VIYKYGGHINPVLYFSVFSYYAPSESSRAAVGYGRAFCSVVPEIYRARFGMCNTYKNGTRPWESGEHDVVYQFSVSCFVNGWGVEGTD